eukprot:10659-Pyramimonas_sp.AAC.1
MAAASFFLSGGAPPRLIDAFRTVARFIQCGRAAPEQRSKDNVRPPRPPPPPPYIPPTVVGPHILCCRV